MNESSGLLLKFTHSVDPFIQSDLQKRNKSNLSQLLQWEYCLTAKILKELKTGFIYFLLPGLMAFTYLGVLFSETPNTYQ